MHIGVTAIGGRVARIVLLACTLFGLAAMHTIGHSAVDRAGHHGRPPAVTPAALAMIGAAPAGPHDCAADGCDPQAARSGGGGHGTGGSDLCVAVLSAFAIAVLLAALLLSAVAGRFPPRSRSGRGGGVPRAPPARPLGLTLATVSVLRT